MGCGKQFFCWIDMDWMQYFPPVFSAEWILAIYGIFRWIY
jgi:hypothetical protein